MRAALWGVVLAAGVGVVVAVEHDSKTTNIDPKFLAALEARPEIIDDNDPLVTQLIKNLMYKGSFGVLLGLEEQTDNLMQHPETKTVSYKSKDMDQNGQFAQIEFKIIAMADDPNTSLKAFAFYHPASKLLIFEFPCSDFFRDFGVINATIIGHPVPTREEVRKFIEYTEQQLCEKNLKVSYTRIYANSLGGGSGIYALDILRQKNFDLASPFYGSMPQPENNKQPKPVLLDEPWQAMIAAQATGTNTHLLSSYIGEIKVYPGDPTAAPYNPVLGSKAGILIFNSKACSSSRQTCTPPTYSFVNRIQEHIDYTGLKIVDSTPEELESVGTTYVAQSAEEILKRVVEILG